MTSLVLGDLILESLTPSVNAPLRDPEGVPNFCKALVSGRLTGVKILVMPKGCHGTKKKKRKKGVCHTVTLLFRLKSILRQKEEL
jgi:hypothetical protein